MENAQHEEKVKVFGIGFHKTATTSLGTALEILGYRLHGEFGVNDTDIRHTALPRALQLARQFDAFEDNPWPLLYRELDRAFPGSKFVLSLRPVEKWLASISRHFGSRSTPMREWIYGVGSPQGNEDIYRRRYERHNAEVAEYFRNRPGDLLVLRITEGEGWEKLCPFLDLPVPGQAFPQVNVGRQGG